MRMDDGQDQDGRFEDEPELDRYLLQFWPSPPAPDQVVRQTSECAAYWHGVTRERPLPPTSAERAEGLPQFERDRAAEHTLEPLPQIPSLGMVVPPDLG
jgi:hypothetical protein